MKNFGRFKVTGQSQGQIEMKLGTSVIPHFHVIFIGQSISGIILIIKGHLQVPGMTGPPNSFTARGPVTRYAILFP